MLFEDLDPSGESLLKTVLLGFHNAGDELLALPELGIEPPHHLHQQRHRPRQKAVFQPQQAPKTGRPPDQATEHIAPAFIGGEDPVGHQKGDPPGVLGDDAQRYLVGAPGSGPSGQIGEMLAERPEKICVIK